MTNVETTEYKGRIFRRYPDAKRRSDRVYFKCTISHKPTFLHRLVYEDNFGRIPKGMHVHHKDGNEANNSPDNLELLTPKAHINEHMDDDRIVALTKNLADNALPKACEWHKDPANREHHVRLGRMSWENFEPKEMQCIHCHEKYMSKTRRQDKYCSNKCRSAARRASGVDDVEKECGFCGGTFSSNKYAKVRFCSKSCKMNNQHAKKKE